MLKNDTYFSFPLYSHMLCQSSYWSTELIDFSYWFSGAIHPRTGWPPAILSRWRTIMTRCLRWVKKYYFYVLEKLETLCSLQNIFKKMCNFIRCEMAMNCLPQQQQISHGETWLTVFGVGPHIMWTSSWLAMMNMRGQHFTTWTTWQLWPRPLLQPMAMVPSWLSVSWTDTTRPLSLVIGQWSCSGSVWRSSKSASSWICRPSVFESLTKMASMTWTTFPSLSRAPNVMPSLPLVRKLFWCAPLFFFYSFDVALLIDG